jgi:hypothetical protein
LFLDEFITPVPSPILKLLEDDKPEKSIENDKEKASSKKDKEFKDLLKRAPVAKFKNYNKASGKVENSKNENDKNNDKQNGDKPKVTTKQTTMVKNAMGIASRTNDNGYLVTDVQVPDTIREHSSVQYVGDASGPELGAYDVTEVNAPNTMRQFTSDIEYFGGAGNDGVNTAPMSYEDIYNAEIKAIRGTIDEGYTPGPMIPNQGVSAETINVTTSKIGDIQNKYLNERGVQANKVYNSIPQMTHINMTQDKEIVPNEPLADRINPVIVNAFKDNPYTQPLDSWA